MLPLIQLSTEATTEINFNFYESLRKEVKTKTSREEVKNRNIYFG